MRMSLASASAKPPPDAAPCTSAMNGCATRRILITSSAILCWPRRLADTLVRAVARRRCCSRRSSPAQKARPAPRRITTRASVSSCSASRNSVQLVDELRAHRVQRLRPVQRAQHEPAGSRVDEPGSRRHRSCRSSCRQRRSNSTPGFRTQLGSSSDLAARSARAKPSGRSRSYQARWSRPTAWWWVIVAPSADEDLARDALHLVPQLELGAAPRGREHRVVRRGPVGYTCVKRQVIEPAPQIRTSASRTSVITRACRRSKRSQVIAVSKVSANTPIETSASRR